MWWSGHRWNWPYATSLSEGLQYSTVSIVIAFAISLLVAIIPFYIARTKLPGAMVLAGGNTMVISAACHVFPRQGEEPRKAQRASREKAALQEDAQLLQAARGPLKWGVAGRIGLPRPDGQDVGHVSFGTRDQGVAQVVEGQWYA